MKIQDIPNGLRISRAAVARILWRAIEAGADSVTLCAIIEFMARGSVMRPRSVNGPVFDEAIAEVTLAAQRSRRAREAAARRREARARAEAMLPPSVAGMPEGPGAAKAVAPSQDGPAAVPATMLRPPRGALDETSDGAHRDRRCMIGMV